MAILKCIGCENEMIHHDAIRYGDRIQCKKCNRVITLYIANHVVSGKFLESCPHCHKGTEIPKEPRTFRCEHCNHWLILGVDYKVEKFDTSGRTISMELPSFKELGGMLNKMPDKPAVLQKQEGGSHYKDMVIQPIEYIAKNNIGYLPGSAIKYLSRYQKKNGIEDIKKAIHYCEMILEMEYGVKKVEPHNYSA